MSGAASFDSAAPAPSGTTTAAEVFGPRLSLASRYVDILATRGIAWGLLGPREADRLWDRHLLNSAAIAGLIPRGSTVVDVGSGAGLPGIPLAIARPDLEVDLLEPLLRRSTFLAQAVDELGMTEHVHVVRTRAEDHQKHYDVVASRALAPLTRLIDWCNPLRSPDGAIVAVKGRSAAEELAAAQPLLIRRGLSGELLTVRAHAGADYTTVVRIRGAG